MSNDSDSIIKERISELQENAYTPEKILEILDSFKDVIKDKPEAQELFEQIQSYWREDLLESMECVDKLQHTLNQYEEELIQMMDQMDALVKCSLLIKQYSNYLKEEIDKIADKIDRQGLDERIDQLVELLEDIKPRKHLSVVRETKVIDFQKKD